MCKDDNPFQSEAFKAYAMLHERSMSETERTIKSVMEDKDQRIAELEAENNELRAQLGRIEKRHRWLGGMG